MKASAIFSTIHSLGAVGMSLLTLLRTLPGGYLWLWSTLYFSIDGIWELFRGRRIFVAHHSLCLLCMWWATHLPPNISARIMSLMLLTELSTPFLQWAQHTKKREDQIRFRNVFFWCRIIYMPALMGWMSVSEPDVGSDKLLVAGLFWLMNLGWYARQR